MTQGAGLDPQQRGGTTMVGRPGQSQPATLADILERVLDKGVVIAGDIRINLLEIELLTIKLRLLIVSVDKAQEMGINWWRDDPMLNTEAAAAQELADENRQLRERLQQLESRDAQAASPTGQSNDTSETSEARGEAS